MIRPGCTKQIMPDNQAKNKGIIRFPKISDSYVLVSINSYGRIVNADIYGKKNGFLDPEAVIGRSINDFDGDTDIFQHFFNKVISENKEYSLKYIFILNGKKYRRIARLVPVNLLNNNRAEDVAVIMCQYSIKDELDRRAGSAHLFQ